MVHTHQRRSTHTICTYSIYLEPLNIDSVLVPRLYSQVIITNCVFILHVIFLLFFSMHCWEGPISKHFTVSLHLLFTKHVKNNIWFDQENAVSSQHQRVSWGWLEAGFDQIGQTSDNCRAKSQETWTSTSSPARMDWWCLPCLGQWHLHVSPKLKAILVYCRNERQDPPGRTIWPSLKHC
jgi:hypothetical protein